MTIELKYGNPSGKLEIRLNSSDRDNNLFLAYYFMNDIYKNRGCQKTFENLRKNTKKKHTMP